MKPYVNRSSLSDDQLLEIYKKLETARPVIVGLLREDAFEDDYEYARCASGATFFIGHEVLRNDSPLASETSDIFQDIYQNYIK